MTKARKFMELAHARARFSKDTSTKVGAIIIGPSGEDRASGYNGAPPGMPCINPETPEERSGPRSTFGSVTPNSMQSRMPRESAFLSEGCTIFVTHPPCMDCARAIVQAGIKRVVTVDQNADFYERWKEHILRSRRLFSECGVEFEVLYANDDQLPV